MHEFRSEETDINYQILLKVKSELEEVGKHYYYYYY